MARLNEPVAPTESIDSLKRRFMRQNREIARANSNQSLRIRNLENEMSRLLSENLSLRAEILRLQTQLEMVEQTISLKAQLKSKIHELSALINGLDGGYVNKERSSKSVNTTRPDPASSPEKNWKNVYSLAEGISYQDGRLPPIMENKSYPRRTLEFQEIAQLVMDAESGATESPEIGPPPVSQFVDEDPVKIDLPRRPHMKTNEENTVLDPALSITVEHRRRRKDSVGLSESKQSLPIKAAPEVQEALGSLKTGAKRKLSARDSDDDVNTGTTRESSPDNFRFTRVTYEDKSKTIVPGDVSESKNAKDLAKPRETPQDQIASTNRARQNRKVLAPKSVNGSPRKASKSLAENDGKPGKLDFLNPVTSRECKAEELIEIPLPQLPVEVILEPIEVKNLPQNSPQNEPETPATAAGLGRLSPSLSQPPSIARMESRDTPPPSDLENGADGSRPNRRARASVRYTEPNLRDKMRRATKQLADAVSKDDRPIRTSIVKIDQDGASVPTSINGESYEDVSWKNMPATCPTILGVEESSPLGSKGSARDALPSNITTHRKRRESLLCQYENDHMRAGTRSTIPTPIAEKYEVNVSVKKKQIGDDEEQEEQEKEKEDEEDETTTAAEINALDLEKASTEDSIQSAPYGKKTRLAQIQPSLAHKIEALSENDRPVTEPDADAVTATKLDSTYRRRQTSLNRRNSSTIPSDSRKGRDAAATAPRVVRKSTSSPVALESRRDRMAARRKSLML